MFGTMDLKIVITAPHLFAGDGKAARVRVTVCHRLEVLEVFAARLSSRTATGGDATSLDITISRSMEVGAGARVDRVTLRWFGVLLVWQLE